MSEFRSHWVILSTLFVALLVAFACAKQTVVVWEKPGAEPGELDAAREACLVEMANEPSPAVNRGRLEAEVSGACFVACMKRKGWTWRTEQVGASEDADDPGRSPSAVGPQEPFDVPSEPPAGCPAPDGGRGGT